MKPKIENVLWVLYKYFDEQLFDELLKSKGIAYYVSDIIKEKDIQIIKQHIQTIIENRSQLKKLKGIPQVKQRSEEWFALRQNRLTASDTGQAMNRGHYGSRAKLVLNKAFPETVVFNSNSPPLKHGTMLEPMSCRCYAQRNGNIKINEFGVLPHPELDCYGASPDGITELGVLIEIKTPWRRKVNGEILDQYELQMQGQMAVTGLNECDFIDCEIEVIESEENYIKNVATHLKQDHGIILENCATKEYLYSPEDLSPQECIEWKNKENKNYKVIYWKLRKIYIERIYFDKKRWETELVPAIQSFWSDVLKMRSETVSPKEPEKTFQFIDSDDDT